MTTYELFVTAWAPGLAVPSVCLLALGGYVFGVRGHLGRRSGSFFLAVVVVFLALSSPIGFLARGYLFSAHMLQHLLLMLAVPPLVLLGLPRSPVSALPAAHGGRHEPVGLLTSWLLGVGAMWFWHAPTLCNAAARSSTVQGAQTASLVIMGLAFWRPILAPQISERLPAFQAILYLFTACVACTVLGVIVTLSPIEVCSAYLSPVDPIGVLPLLRDGWGMSCKADQEIGGLLMWVPTCLVYAAAILATLGRYYAEEAPSLRQARGAP